MYSDSTISFITNVSILCVLIKPPKCLSKCGISDIVGVKVKFTVIGIEYKEITFYSISYEIV